MKLQIAFYEKILPDLMQVTIDASECIYSSVAIDALQVGT